MREQEARRQSNETALVLVRGKKEIDDFIKATIGKIRTTRGERVANDDAYQSGVEAGQSINVAGGGKVLNGRQRLLA